MRRVGFIVLCVLCVMGSGVGVGYAQSRSANTTQLNVSLKTLIAKIDALSKQVSNMNEKYDVVIENQENIREDLKKVMIRIHRK